MFRPVFYLLILYDFISTIYHSGYQLTIFFSPQNFYLSLKPPSFKDLKIINDIQNHHQHLDADFKKRFSWLPFQVTVTNVKIPYFHTLVPVYTWFTKCTPVKKRTASPLLSLLQNHFGKALSLFYLLSLRTKQGKRKERRNKITGRQIIWIKNRINAPFV